MNTSTELADARRSISFHKDEIASEKPPITLTDEDSDDFKMESLEKLLLKMKEFSRVMKEIGLPVRKNKQGKCVHALTHKLYSDNCSFRIYLQGEHFDTDYRFALHAGFTFSLFIEQGVHHEISDWIRLGIRYTHTNPHSLSSNKDYSGNKYLKQFYRGNLFFNGIPLGVEKRNDDFYSFKSDQFCSIVTEACLLLDKLLLEKAGLEYAPFD